MSAHALAAGHDLQEYRVEKLLGVGGFGLTYLALDRNLNLRVALKEYLPNDIALRTADQTIRPKSEETTETFNWGKRRFLDESRTLASFRHPNIVRVMRFFEANGTAYMVMEFVAGAPLTDWITPRRPLSEAQAVALAGPLLDGLDVVHKAGYMHRDIKPGNVYVRDDDSPVLLDFGSARMQASELTAVVSPGYAPFEQYHTQGNQGPWSDLYAVGGVLYWLVTGNRPHEAAARIRQDNMPPALRAGDRSLYRAEFLAAIDWALAPHEDERPQSVAEWRPALLGEAPATHEKTRPLRPVSVTPGEVASRTQRAPQSAAAPAALVIDPALLKKLEAELAQHVGPIAGIVIRNSVKTTASLAELIPRLANEIPDAVAKAAFETKFSESSRPVSQPTSQPRSGPSASSVSAPPTALAASRFAPEVLDRAEQRLAEYIGAVARVVVKRAAMKARDEAELYLLVADEIEDKNEKKAFIRKAISVAGKP